MRLKSARFLAFLLFLTGSVAGVDAQPDSWKWVSRTRMAAPNAQQASKTGAVSIDYPENCLGFDWNPSSSRWDSLNRFEFSYVSTGGLQEKLGWFFSGNTFILDTRETHHYNAQGFDSLTVVEEWTGSTWEPSYKFDRTFDPYGNVTQSIGSTWDGFVWDTSSGYRATFTYHPNAEVARVIQEGYVVGSGWNPEYQQTWSLDGLGRWDTVTGYLPNQGGWIPDKRLLDLHWRDFAKNQPDSARFESYATGDWEDFQRFRVTYSQYDSQEWIYEKPGLGWVPTDRFIFNYDSLGYEVLNEAFTWNAGWDQFDGIITHLTYDSLGQRTEVWTEVLSNGSYVKDKRQVYLDFFTESPSPQFQEPSWVIFPNPARQGTEIQVSLQSSHQGATVLEIMDLRGQGLSRAEFPASSLQGIRMQLSDALQPGIYICRVQIGNAVGLGRLVILQ